jgi:ribosome-associated toxin RatA of RatAB toxin-antitoxin module
MTHSSDPADVAVRDLDLTVAEDGAALEDPNRDAADVTISVTVLEGRRRQIQAVIEIPCSQETLWRVLSDYENLATFIPNLVESSIVGQEEGCTLVRQVGRQQFLLLKFAAAVTLKIRESYPHTLAFEMIKGDFLEFAGTWELTPLPTGTQLTYSLTIHPPRHMPLQVVERCLKHDLAANLRAVRDYTLNFSA